MAGDDKNLNPMVDTIEFLVGVGKWLAKKMGDKWQGVVKYFDSPNDPKKGNDRKPLALATFLAVVAGFSAVVMHSCSQAKPNDGQTPAGNKVETKTPAVNKEPVKTETPNPNNNQETPSEDGKKTKEKNPGEKNNNPPVIVEVYGKGQLPPLLYSFMNERTKN